MRGNRWGQRLRALPETPRCNVFQSLPKRNVVLNVGEGSTPTLTTVRLSISCVFHVVVGATFHECVDCVVYPIRVNKIRLIDGAGRESTGADPSVEVL